MRRHASFLIAVGAMVALSVLFALRPRQTGTTILPPHGGLISDHGVAAPDSEAVPKRENRLLNNWLSEKDGDGRQGDRAVCAFRCF
jgi:hypothetical protein